MGGSKAPFKGVGQRRNQAHSKMHFILIRHYNIVYGASKNHKKLQQSIERRHLLHNFFHYMSIMREYVPKASRFLFEYINFSFSCLHLEPVPFSCYSFDQVLSSALPHLLLLVGLNFNDNASGLSRHCSHFVHDTFS
jgi:hypothetical protein